MKQTANYIIFGINSGLALLFLVKLLSSFLVEFFTRHTIAPNALMFATILILILFLEWRAEIRNNYRSIFALGFLALLAGGYTTLGALAQAVEAGHNASEFRLLKLVALFTLLIIYFFLSGIYRVRLSRKIRKQTD